MVLQSTSDGGRNAIIYGTGLGDRDVLTLTVIPAGTTAAAVTAVTAAVATHGASTGRRWRINVAVPAGGPYTLQLTLNNAVVGTPARDVWFGDVFICSGQSNMVYALNGIDDAKKYIKAAKHYPNIRLFHADEGLPAQTGVVPFRYRFRNATGGVQAIPWQVASPTTVGGFSAICYLAAMNVADTLRARGHKAAGPNGTARAFGLVQSAVGGTPVEAWSPAPALAHCDVSAGLPTPIQSGDMVANKTSGDGNGTRPVNASAEVWGRPATLWNQMAGPLVGYAARTFLWYQGEANMNEGYHLTRHNYFCLFSSMIQAWRGAWAWADGGGVTAPIPFNFVQLHSCDDGNDGQVFADFANYGDIRLAQDDTRRFLPGVGMAVAFDRGHVGIHSPHKAEVARRLALKVLRTAYAGDHPTLSVDPTETKARGGAASSSSVVYDSGPRVLGACVRTPPSPFNGTNVTEVEVLLDTSGVGVRSGYFAVGEDGGFAQAPFGGGPGGGLRRHRRKPAGLVLKPTDECKAQAGENVSYCCNVTAPTQRVRGVAPGVAQLQVGDVWRGEVWIDAAMRIEKAATPDGLVPGASRHALVLSADLGDMMYPWNNVNHTEDSPVWQVRFSVGAFPGCAVYTGGRGPNANDVPLAPFGPLAVAPSCRWDGKR